MRSGAAALTHPWPWGCRAVLMDAWPVRDLPRLYVHYLTLSNQELAGLIIVCPVRCWMTGRFKHLQIIFSVYSRAVHVDLWEIVNDFTTWKHTDYYFHQEKAVVPVPLVPRPERQCPVPLSSAEVTCHHGPKMPPQHQLVEMTCVQGNWQQGKASNVSLGAPKSKGWGHQRYQCKKLAWSPEGVIF